MESGRVTDDQKNEWRMTQKWMIRRGKTMSWYWLRKVTAIVVGERSEDSGDAGGQVVEYDEWVWWYMVLYT